MSTEKKQSAIQEVRDQLSLDYADGKYLNIVGSNLGLTRPRIGFTDDSWRAVVKALALHYKQIKTKFEELLAIFFGPRITVDSGLIADTVVGQRIVFMEDHEDWPQLGTVIFDEGLATEETLTYCLIDRSTHEMFLSAPLAFAHVATVKNTEQALIGVDLVTNDRIIVSEIAPFPDVNDVGPYTVVIGAGTDAEESKRVLSVDYTNRILAFVSPLANTHTPTAPSNIQSTLARDYNPVHPTTGIIQEQGVALLTLTDTHRFPTEGDLLLGPAGPGAAPTNDVFSATGGSTTTITQAVGTFETGGHSGSRVVFADDTLTVALQGLEVLIVENTGIQLTLGETLPATVVATDTYRIRAHVHYTSIDYTLNTVTLIKHIPDITIETQGILVSDLVGVGSTDSVIQLQTGGLILDAHRGQLVTIGSVSTEIVSNDASSITVLPFLPVAPTVGAVVEIRFATAVELMEPVVKWNATGESVDVAQIKSPGTGWDVIQTNPRCVEILTPNEIQDVRDIRSASYLHTNVILPQPTTTLADAVVVDDLVFNVADPTNFPVVGVVTVGGAENVTYHNLETYLVDSADSGATEIVVPNSTKFPGTGDIIIDFGGSNEETVTISANDPVTNTLTISALANDHLDFTKIRDVRFQIPFTGFSAGYAGGSAVALYQPARSGTTLLDGNLWQIEDVFPGPYVYKPDELTWGGLDLQVSRTAPSIGVATTNNTKLVPGPQQIAIDQFALGKTALEIEDASAFELVVFPYDVRVAGAGTGNQETLSISDVNLRQRTFTAVSLASVAGASSLEVTALTGGIGVADSFPDVNGYRVLIDKNGANEEVALVTATSTGPDTLTFELPLVLPHVITESVELMADVLSTSPVADKHEGIVDYESRSTRSALALPAGTGIEARWPVISSVDRTSAEIVAPAVEEILIDDTTNFPSTGKVYLNFSRTAGGVADNIPFTTEVKTTASVVATDVFIPVPDVNVFPVAAASTLSPFVVILDPGGLKEERVLVTGSTGSQLDLASSLRFPHAANTRVEHINSKEELLTYTSVVGNTLRFSPPIVLQFSHSPGESAILSLVDSEPSEEGYDFPLYLPPDLSFRLQSLLDLVRAAGVNVKFIDQR